MPHERLRHGLSQFKKLASFWPVVGVLGLRQVGKTTLLRNLFGLSNFASLDDEEAREEAQKSAKGFLAKLATPVIIDEVQKAPSLFDAIKLEVDKKKIPGSFLLSGSSTFSAKLGIRESLTGRIAMLQLHPFTLAETHQKNFEAKRAAFFHQQQVRFTSSEVIQNLSLGGMPVPAFIRDADQRKAYFQNWLETTVVRDIARLYGRGYDMDVSWSILRQFAKILENGELATLRLFKQDSRVVKRYLAAFESVFLIRKVPCHEEGIGDDYWIFSDSGLAASLIDKRFGDGVNLSLARIFIIKEILANHEYSGKKLHPVFYKSARGSPIDLMHDDVLIKITTETKGRLNYEERALAGAMKTLGASRGLLVAPVERFEPPKKKGISVVPWGYWS